MVFACFNSQNWFTFLGRKSISPPKKVGYDVRFVPFPWKVRLEKLHDLKKEVFFHPCIKTKGNCWGPLIFPHMPDTTHT